MAKNRPQQTAKKAHKKELRRERRQKEKTMRVRQARRQKILVGGAVVATIALAGFLLFQAADPTNQPGTAVRSLGNQHIRAGDSHIQYNTVPPTSGPHLGGRASWGIQTQKIPDELQIHNLEEGGVILQYDCTDECPELEEELSAFADEVLNDGSFLRGRGSIYFILAPYAGIREASDGSPLALTAWGRIQYFDELDRSAMLEFIGAYISNDHHSR